MGTPNHSQEAAQEQITQELGFDSAAFRGKRIKREQEPQASQLRPQR